MEKDEYKEEIDRVSDIEVVKIKSVFDKANVFLFRSSIQLINGDIDNFIRGISLSELTLRPKLKAKYFEEIEKKKKELTKSPENVEDPLLDLALFKYEKINSFLDKQTPVKVYTELK